MSDELINEAYFFAFKLNTLLTSGGNISLIHFAGFISQCIELFSIQYRNPPFAKVLLSIFINMSYATDGSLELLYNKHFLDIVYRCLEEYSTENEFSEDTLQSIFWLLSNICFDSSECGIKIVNSNIVYQIN